MASHPNSPLPQIAIFPFMSKGHTIPLIHLANLLHHRHLVSQITFFTTPLNAPWMLVKEWVDQIEILAHKSVQGFMSHCGWNSVMESVCAGVPLLAWPMMAEQRLNAKFVVEELKMGLRVRASDGTKHGLVRAEDVARLSRELLLGEEGKAAKRKAGELAEAARLAMSEGGSSYAALEKMIRDVCVHGIT